MGTASQGKTASAPELIRGSGEDGSSGGAGDRPSDYLVNGYTERVAEANSDRSVNGGSDAILVRLESQVRPDDAAIHRLTVSVNVDVRGGPDRGEDGTARSVPFNVWPNDLPVLISCLIRAAVIADRDGVITALPPAGRQLLRDLDRVLYREIMEGRRRPKKG